MPHYCKKEVWTLASRVKGAAQVCRLHTGAKPDFFLRCKVRMLMLLLMLVLMQVC